MTKNIDDKRKEKKLLNNKGFSLVENLAAGVIIAIILTVVGECIMTASGWYADSEKIKNQGEAVADKADGGTVNNVDVSTEELTSMILKPVEGGSESIDFSGNTDKITYSYQGTDVYLKSLNTEVAKPVSDDVYEATRQTVKELDDIIRNISKVFFDNMNLPWVAQIRTKVTGGKWPAISGEFSKKYGIKESSYLKLYVNVYTYNRGDYIFYATTSNNMGLLLKYDAYMIYDTDSRCWYLAPKSGSAYNTLYVGQILGGFNSSDEVMSYVKNPSNGWTILIPNA